MKIINYKEREICYDLADLLGKLFNRNGVNYDRIIIKSLNKSLIRRHNEEFLHKSSRCEDNEADL